jgi:hypothetical protein
MRTRLKATDVTVKRYGPSGCTTLKLRISGDYTDLPSLAALLADCGPRLRKRVMYVLKVKGPPSPNPNKVDLA